ncbi:MAG: hypothetical protein WC783_03150 [Candidatus Paceibacterota bacterium]|jgi:hypothetical protein
MKKPFIYALGAVAYIIIVVSFMTYATAGLPETKFLVPVAMLSLFVLSVAMMGFFFLSEPLKLYMDGRKQEAMSFFLKMLGVFASFVVLVFLCLFLFFK